MPRLCCARKRETSSISLMGKILSYQGRIESLSPDRIEGVILSQEKGKTSSSVELILCQALIKGPKWDWLVEKACEIGVTKLVPILTARTIVKPSGKTRSEWSAGSALRCRRPSNAEGRT